MTGLRGRLGALFGRKAKHQQSGPEAPPSEVPAAIETPAPAGQAAAPEPAVSAQVACYRLTTASGLFLTVIESGAGAAVLETRPALDAAHAVVALVPDALPSACLLVAPDGRAFAVPGDSLRCVAVSGRLLRTDAPGIVRLKYPLGSEGYLCAGDPPSDTLRFDAAGDTMQAAFALLKVAPDALTAGVQSLVKEFGAAASDGLRAAPLLARLRNGTLRAELAEPLVRLMPQDELDELGRRLLHDAADRALLTRAFAPDAQIPASFWLRQALPALALWHTGGRPAVPGNALLSPPADEAPLLPVTLRGVMPAGLALHALARRHVLPSRTACLLATARNEGPYLLDWISYHLSIGFEHIFLYTNDNDDGSDALLAALARHGVITLVQNPRGPQTGPQTKAYAHALTMLPQLLDYRWTAILDLDEYLAFDTRMFGSITEFIGFHETQPVDALALCWALFASVPGETWTDTSSMSRFTRRASDINVHVKSIFRTRLFWYSQPHFPSATLDAPFHYRTQDGRIHHHAGVEGRIAAFAERPSANQAWVNHYMLRTADEALWKWARGRADWLADDITGQRGWFLDFVSRTFLDLAQPERLVEDRRILACAGGQGRVLENLLALPGVAEAEASVKADFASRLRRNTAAFLASPLAPDAPETLRHFRDLIAATA